MKIIALIPVKNEGWILETCLTSLAGIADEIIAIDDGSSDNSADILKKHGSIVIPAENKLEISWAEHSIRQKLLLTGRERGGTHFICLDGDEAFSSDFKSHAHETFLGMKQGETLEFKWITLWQSTASYRDDGIYKDLCKDFVFCDDGISEYPYAFLGVQRTPGNSIQSSKKRIPEDIGVVLHFQYVNFKRSQLKQAWYRCSEFLKKERSARRINNAYRHSLPIDAAFPPAKKEWLAGLPAPAEEEHSDYITKINGWFEEYGISYFEPLQIWHIRELRDTFLEKTGREPRSLTYPLILVKLNELKNKILKK